MNYAPHILQIYHPAEFITDDEGVMTPGLSWWETVGECRCDDNGGLKQIGVNGQAYTYNYHIVYEGAKLSIGTKVRAVEADALTMNEIPKEFIRGEGEVIKPGKCNYLNYSEVWL